MGERTDKFKAQINSPRGKNFITFLVFLAISSVLWIVMSLNDEAQRDLRCDIEIINIPDSVTQINHLPEAMNVSVRSRGTSLLKYLFSNHAMMKIDYRTYSRNNRIRFNEAGLKAFFRNAMGANVQVLTVSPDSLNISFTASKGIKVPVTVDANVVPGPQFAIIGKVRAICDTVTLYSAVPMKKGIKSISTVPIVLNDVRSSQTLKVPLLTPPDVRAIPDSVEVHIDVEPLVAKNRRVPITPVNVPSDVRLITVPNTVDVYYMVPMSIYKSADSNPNFTIHADYRTIQAGDSKIAVTLKKAPKDFLNVFVDVDSVDFMIEAVE